MPYFKTGQFESTTKTKIKTEHGTVLKETTYEPGCSELYIEYKTAPRCSICGDRLDCMCFSSLESATKSFKKGDCWFKYELGNDPDYVKQLIEEHNGDVDAVKEHLVEVMCDSDVNEGSWCEL